MRTSSEKIFHQEVYFYDSTNTRISKSTRTLTEGWNPYTHRNDEQGKISISATDQDITVPSTEKSLLNLNFVTTPGQKYLLTATANAWILGTRKNGGQNGDGPGTTYNWRIRENSGSNTGVSGTQRAIDGTVVPGVASTLERYLLARDPNFHYEFTAGSTPQSLTFHLTQEVTGGADDDSNMPDLSTISNIALRVDPVQ